MARNTANGERGFTLIELLIVVAIIGILSSMAVVQLRQTPQRAKEAALKENLYVLRNCIDQYFTDKGKYPDSLQVLVEDGYMRRIPVDPITQSDSTWVEDQADTGEGDDSVDPSAVGGVADVHSGADGTALDGSNYKDW
ncbi:MAG TPA: type II secretion system protein [Candidatus Cryosericum sp.]|nr:type II secretion system protein [Candidatus Cryosericum sp.]